MVGETFNNWFVIRQVSGDSHGRKFECRCKCGRIALINAYDLHKKKRHNCQDCYHKGRADKAYPNFVGSKKGDWIVLRRNDNGKRSASFECKCKCGQIAIVSAQKLKNGCKQCEECHLKEYGFKQTHGKCETKTYITWSSMRQRCKNKKKHNYKDYGGRGIEVCKRWESFENFLADMGEKPEGKNLDRINNDGNYEPSNCRWIDAFENANNRRNSEKYKELYISGTFPKSLFCPECIKKIKEYKK